MSENSEFRVETCHDILHVDGWGYRVYPVWKDDQWVINIKQLLEKEGVLEEKPFEGIYAHWPEVTTLIADALCDTNTKLDRGRI